MNTTTDGGPAFPRAGDSSERMCAAWKPQPGMSLRDYFAGHAVAGVLASTADPNSPGLSPKEAAEFAYRIADAMLALRLKEGE